jgi:hypothetical protein
VPVDPVPQQSLLQTSTKCWPLTITGTTKVSDSHRHTPAVCQTEKEAGSVVDVGVHDVICPRAYQIQKPRGEAAPKWERNHFSPQSPDFIVELSAATGQRAKIESKSRAINRSHHVQGAQFRASYVHSAKYV